jgi:hypothetical protein
MKFNVTDLRRKEKSNTKQLKKCKNIILAKKSRRKKLIRRGGHK